MTKTMKKAVLLFTLSVVFSVCYFTLSLDRILIRVFGDFPALVIYLVAVGVSAAGAAILSSFELMDRSANVRGAKARSAMVLGTSLAVAVIFFMLLTFGDTIESGSALGALWIPGLLFATILSGLCIVMILGLTGAYTNNAIDKFFSDRKKRKQAIGRASAEGQMRDGVNEGCSPDEEAGAGSESGSDMPAAASTFFEGKVGEFLDTDRFRFMVKGYKKAENLKELEKERFREEKKVTSGKFFFCMVRIEVENRLKKDIFLNAEGFMLNWGHENPEEAFGQGHALYKISGEAAQEIFAGSRIKLRSGRQEDLFVVFRVPPGSYEEYSLVYFDSEPSSAILSKMYVVHMDEIDEINVEI